jgi:hypothetical protein
MRDSIVECPAPRVENDVERFLERVGVVDACMACPN